MTETNQPTSVDIEPKPVQALESPSSETSAPPASVTEEPFDRERAMETIHKLRDIEKQYKKDQKEFERLKAEEQKRIEAQMTETERLKKQLDEVAQQKAQLETDVIRRDVIQETGLPAVFADRLKGATKEEMLADAEIIKAALPKIPKKPNETLTNPGQASIEETDAQKRDRLFGQQSNIFDYETVKKMGGGVVWNSKE